MDWINKLSFGYLQKATPSTPISGESNKINQKPKQPGTVPPTGGDTSPSINKSITSEIFTQMDFKEVLVPGFERKIIPTIRLLTRFNADFGQALYDITQLANTGIDISFDESVTPDKRQEMVSAIEDASELWCDGCAGMTGLITKMMSQLMVGGAISNEWVLNSNLRGVGNIVFLNPEEVAWVREGNRYKPYQLRVGYRITDKKMGTDSLNKLNPSTYKYFALGGDEDSPYGIPPYLTGLDPIGTQGDMMKNMKFIMKNLGMLGYLNVLVEKPEIGDDESDDDYKKRLDRILTETKESMDRGLADGISVGYKNDHEFEFQATNKNMGNFDTAWQTNELQVASGLKFDAAFLGRSYNTSETSITILFTKMMSQLTSIQELVSKNLSFGFKLHLLSLGYQVKKVKVTFNKSTITDSLKYQQAEEIKIRNASKLYADGIDSIDDYAKRIGRNKADQREPRIPLIQTGTPDEVAKKKKRKGQKQDAQKKTTDKKNPQGTIRKQNN